MKSRMKKITALLLVATLGVVGMTGCGSTQEEPTAPEGEAEATTEEEAPAEEEASFEGTELTLMASQNWIKEIDNELFAKFEEETGIKVEVSLTPDNEYASLLGTTLTGGSDAIDIFMHAAGSEMISAGIPDVALDLSGEEWVDRQETWAKDANTVDGKQIGFGTWGIDYEGVMYNKTFFEENDLVVPTTWDEFITLCDDILALGTTPLYEGINGVWHTQSWVYGMTPTIIAENPDYASYLNESKDNKFSDFEGFMTGLGQLQELLSNTDYYTNDGQAEDWHGSYPSLQERDTVMMFTYSAYPAELEANGATDEFGMFPVPLMDNQIAVSNGGGISKFINVNSKNIDAAKMLFEFLAEDENLEVYYGARTDLVTSAFKDVESVSSTTATEEILAGNTDDIKPMFIKEVLYWDPDVYQYLQGMADGSVTPEKFAENVDTYRATMFDTVGEE